MQSSKRKWLIYTVMVGLIPVVARAIVWMITKPGTLEIIAAADFIAFGLVLHISNINEIEHVSTVDRDWKTTQNGFSIMFIACYSVLFAFALLDESVVSRPGMLYLSVLLAVVSFVISYSIFYHLERHGATP